MRDESLPAGHFEALYAARPDPWRLASSDYERAKQAATLAALPRVRYARAFEVGCAIGVLSAALAPRCAALLAVDIAEAALVQARERLAGSPHVTFARMAVPDDWPEGGFDLVVLSEVIDYLGRDDVLRLADRLRAAVLPGGDILLVHWVGKKSGPSTGAEASDVLVAALADACEPLRQDRNPDYRVDVLRRV